MMFVSLARLHRVVWCGVLAAYQVQFLPSPIFLQAQD